MAGTSKVSTHFGIRIPNWLLQEIALEYDKSDDPSMSYFMTTLMREAMEARLGRKIEVRKRMLPGTARNVIDEGEEVE